MVLIDIGCVVGGLRSDITRTFFVGKPKAIWTKTYLQVLAAQEKALKALKAPTIGGQQLDVVARNYFKRLKLDRHFIHGLGHGIGKWIHQHPKISPKSNATIKPGDVITIEPGLYFSTKGRSASGGKNRFGIRIEDTVVKTKNGFTYLTHFPKDLKSVTIS
jgi:Xaa-Pro aminopeptidase